MRIGVCSLCALGTVLTIGTRASAQFAEPEVQILYTLYGEVAGDNFGFVGDSAGDINGDGAPEIIGGAPYRDDENGSNTGRAHLYDGATGVLMHTFAGEVAQGFFGSSVNGAGDVNNDGVLDVIVGAPGAVFSNPGAVTGAVYVFSGKDYSLIWSVSGDNAGDRFGIAVDGADDINDDGHDDVVVGVEGLDDNGVNNVGRVLVLSGVDGSVLRMADGAALRHRLGNGVSGIGDVNDDGVRDFVASARGAGPTAGGETYVFSGADSSVLHVLTPGSAASNAGWFFTSAVGDVDNDGVEDVYVPEFSTNKAFVYSGATGDSLWTFLGEPGNAGFGIGRGAGDVNNDGHADLYIAAYLASEGASSAGKGYLLSGRDGAVLRTTTCVVPGGQAGYDAFGAGDVNGDGAPDLAITAPFDDASATNAGAIYVIAGIPSCAADLNHDGVTNGIDIGLYLQAFATGSPTADYDADGDADGTDVGLFLGLYSGGC